MENISQDKDTVPEEEKQQEEELLKEVPVDEVKQSILDEYGLNVDDDEELINKLVEKDTVQRKSLSTAIKQKRSWREKANAPTEQKLEVKPQPEVKKEEIPQDFNEVVNKGIQNALDKRDLEALDIQDTTRESLLAYAKANDLTIKDAMKSTYFTFLKQEDTAAKKVEEASLGTTPGAPSTETFDVTSPPDVDLTTEDGRKTWESYTEWLKTQ